MYVCSCPTAYDSRWRKVIEHTVSCKASWKSYKKKNGLDPRKRLDRFL